MKKFIYIIISILYLAYNTIALSKRKSKSHSKRSTNFKKDEIYRFDATHEGLRNNHHSNHENQSVRTYRTDREKANEINSFSFSGEANKYPSLLNNYVRNVNFYE